MREVDRSESRDMPLVQPQEVAARGQIVVDDVEHAAVDAPSHPRADDGVGAVVDEGERDRIRPAKGQKNAERVDPDPAGDRSLTGSVHISGPQDHVRNAEPPAVLVDDLVLLHFAEAIRIAATLRMRLNWA